MRLSLGRKICYVLLGALVLIGGWLLIVGAAAFFEN